MRRDDVTVVVQPANQAPVVNAGPDQRVLSLATALAGSVSDDGKPPAAPSIELERRERGSPPSASPTPRAPRRR